MSESAKERQENDYRGCQPLTKAEESLLWAAIARGSAEARDRMIETHLPLVLSIAKTLSDKAVPQEDLTNDGVVGLVNAVSTFDATKGYRFSTYASPCISNAMHAAMVRSHAINVKKANVARLKKVAAAVESLKIGGQTYPTDTMVASEAGLEPVVVSALRPYLRGVLSLNQVIGNNEDGSDFELIETISDPDAICPREEAKHHELLRDLGLDGGDEYVVLDDTRKDVYTMRSLWAKLASTTIPWAKPSATGVECGDPFARRLRWQKQISA